MHHRVDAGEQPVEAGGVTQVAGDGVVGRAGRWRQVVRADGVPVGVQPRDHRLAHHAGGAGHQDLHGAFSSTKLAVSSWAPVTANVYSRSVDTTAPPAVQLTKRKPDAASADAVTWLPGS